MSSDLKLTDIFDLNELQQLQDCFSSATGVASLITTPSGDGITQPSNFTDFCHLVRTSPLGLANCVKSDALNAYTNETASCIYKCLSAGLWDACVKIRLYDKHIANWLIGQVRNENSDLDHIIAYGNKIGIDSKRYVDALQKVSVMSTTQFSNVTKMLELFVNELTEKAYRNIEFKQILEQTEKTNEMLHKSEESLRITLNSIGDGVISTDVNGVIISMNPMAESLCGWSAEEATGRPLSEVFVIHDYNTNEKVESPVNKVIRTGKRIGLSNHTVLTSRDGKQLHISDCAAPIRDKEGEVTGVVLVFADVTEKYLVEENLKKNEEKYRDIFENIQDVFYKVDLEGRIFELSPSAKHYPDFFDFSKPNQNVHNLYLNNAERDKFLQAIMKEGEVRDYELDIKGMNNTVKHVSINAKLIRDAKGNPHHINGALRDITKRKNAQLALLESERFLSEIQKIASIGNWTIDFKSGEWTCSEVMEQILGLDPAMPKNLETFNEIIHPEWLDEMNEYFFSVVATNQTKFDKKLKIIRLNDKTVRWVHAIGEIRMDENQQLNLMIGTVQDITKRKLDKEALKKSQEELKKYAAHLQYVREEERNLLAREIHDDLGQILIAMKIDLGLLKQNILKVAPKGEYESVKNDFVSLEEMVDNTLKSARRIMTDLRPEVLDMIGFAETVNQHLKNFQYRYKIDCKFENNTSKLLLTTEQSVALFRIVQEALNNVAKHSRAKHVKIILTQTNQKFMLRIEDDGSGFDTNEKRFKESYGLIGMRERVFLLDGDLVIKSEVGMGTSIFITVPYTHKKHKEYKSVNL